MLRKLIAGLCLAALLACPADARRLCPTLCGRTTAAVFNPTVDLSFSGGTALGCASFAACLTTTNASGGYCTDAAGLLHLIAPNTARICSGTGLLIEMAATNSALRARDMTQAAWVAVGIGTVLNASGADGSANAASTLTASGTAGSCTASCTVLQSLTIGSVSEVYSVYLKRVSGSGTVNITNNNLGTLTPCIINSSTFTRCSVIATLANPVIGIQMTVVGDAVVADFNQLETVNLTSPIATTTVAATRNTDLVLASGSLLTALTPASGSLVLNANGTNLQNSGQYLSANGPFVFPPNTSSITAFYGGTGSTATLGSGSTLGATVLGISWSPTTVALVANNGAVVDHSAGTGWAATAPYQIGGTGGGSYLGTFSRLRTYALLPDAILKNIQ